MAHFQDDFLHILVQLAVIILAARVGGWLMTRIGQPQVVGEILAGLTLGPSLLGRVAPELVTYVFPEELAFVFHVLSELGLVLLMFLIGLEFDFRHLRQVGRTSLWVAVAGITLPFGLGLVLAWSIHPIVAPTVPVGGFVLIVGVALSITAIPILGRIMMELGIQRSRIGTLTITAAAVDDALGWILLAAVSAAVAGGFDWGPVAQMLALTLAFVAGCWWIARPLLAKVTPWLLRQGELTLGGFSFVLLLVFLSAIATNRIGIFSIFGPFVIGAALSEQSQLREAIGNRLKQLVYALFLPIFFTYTGLRTDIGALYTVQDILICLLVLLVATVGKVGGCGLAARLGGLSWRESACIAVMMNTRALMGLIAINVGRELGVVPERMFSMLVLMALATTFLTTPLLRRLLPDDQEAPSDLTLSRRRPSPAAPRPLAGTAEIAK